MKIFYVNKPLQYEIKVMKFLSGAANGLATRVFQKCNWGQIGPMVDRGLKIMQILAKKGNYLLSPSENVNIF